MSPVLKPMREYSRICVSRKVSPSSTVKQSPACSPQRLPRLIDVSAQWKVKLDVTRIAVLTPATYTGRWYGSGGHSGALLTTRTKK